MLKVAEVTHQYSLPNIQLHNETIHTLPLKNTTHGGGPASSTLIAGIRINAHVVAFKNTSALESLILVELALGRKSQFCKLRRRDVAEIRDSLQIR